MDFELESTSERFDALDERWLAQVAQLTADLRREVGGVSLVSTPEAGQKGDIGTIVMALGSAGAFTAAVELIKAFVARDEDRSVRLSWHEGGELASLEIGGQGVDDAVMQRVVGALDRASGASA